MASKEGEQAFAPVLAAVATMQGNVPRSEKAQAHEFLEKFQKSVRLAIFIVIDSADTSRSRRGPQRMLFYSHQMYRWRPNCLLRPH